MSDLEREMSMLQGMDLSGTVAPVQPTATVAQVQATQTFAQPITNEQLQAQAQVVQPTQTAVVPPVQQSVQPQVLNLDVAQKETDEIPLVYVKMGQKASTAVMDKFKAQKDENKRVAIFMPFFDKKNETVKLPSGEVISKDQMPYPIKRHYSEELGSFICWEGECCTYEDKPVVRYLFPVIEYPIANNDASRTLPENYGDCKLKLLVAGNELYTTLANIYSQHNNSFDGYDLIMTCTEQQFQNFTVMATNETVRNNYKSFQQCVEHWLKVRDQAYTVVARKMDLEYYKTQKGLNNNVVNTAMPSGMPTLNDLMQ